MWPSLLSLFFGHHHCWEMGKIWMYKAFFVNELPFLNKGFSYNVEALPYFVWVLWSFSLPFSHLCYPRGVIILYEPKILESNYCRCGRSICVHVNAALKLYGSPKFRPSYLVQKVHLLKLIFFRQSYCQTLPQVEWKFSVWLHSGI